MVYKDSNLRVRHLYLPDLSAGEVCIRGSFRPAVSGVQAENFSYSIRPHGYRMGVSTCIPFDVTLSGLELKADKARLGAIQVDRLRIVGAPEATRSMLRYVSGRLQDLVVGELVQHRTLPFVCSPGFEEAAEEMVDEHGFKCYRTSSDLVLRVTQAELVAAEIIPSVDQYTAELAAAARAKRANPMWPVSTRKP